MPCRSQSSSKTKQYVCAFEKHLHKIKCETSLPHFSLQTFFSLVAFKIYAIILFNKPLCFKYHMR